MTAADVQPDMVKRKSEMLASKKMLGKMQFHFKSRSQLKHFLLVETIALNCHTDSMRIQWKNVRYHGTEVSSQKIQKPGLHKKLAHFTFS